MSDKNKSVLLFHNIIAPYRLPVFERLGVIYNLFVMLLEKSDKNRLWDQSVNSNQYSCKTLESFSVELFSKKIIFPSFLTVWQPVRSHDIIILLGDPPNILQMFIVLVYAKLMGKKTILWSSMWEGYYLFNQNDFSSRVIKILLGYLEKNVDAIVAYGCSARRYLINKGIDEEKIFIGTQSLPGNYPKQPNYNQDGVVRFLVVSYLWPRKGIDDLINTFHSLKYENIELRIIGSGVEEENLKKLAVGDARIKFLGYMEGNKKYSEYMLSDVFVLPSYKDSWGLVINEAMHFGLPIIVAQGAACSEELVDGNGYIFPPGSIDQLKEQLISLIEDQNLREKMGKKSFELIAKYNLDYVINAFSSAISYAKTH